MAMPKMWVDYPEEVIQPDVVVPVQFARLWHSSSALPPERRLALAILRQAVEDLQKHRFARSRKHQRLYMEAYAWVDEDDPTWEFSFTNLCRLFNIEPVAARPLLLDTGGGAPVEMDEAA